MQALLRLKGKIRPEKQRSAVSYQPSVSKLWKLTKYCALDNASTDRIIGYGDKRYISASSFRDHYKVQLSKIISV
jgi:hypothetical protein